MADKNNIGNRNSGDCNSGNRNSGNRNSGDWNSGDWNSGDCNSGDCNSGYWNSGNWNSGDCNSGDCNSGNRNSGIFNTDEPKMRSFNKECDITFSQWINSDSYIIFDVPLNEWIQESDMTEEQKKSHPDHKKTGGFLLSREYREAWAEWWQRNKSPKMEARIRKLPNFDADIFYEITGIDLRDKTVDDSDIIEIKGIKYRRI